MLTEGPFLKDIIHESKERLNMESDVVRKILRLIVEGEGTEKNIRRALFPVEQAVVSALTWFTTGSETPLVDAEKTIETVESLSIAASMFKIKDSD